MNISNAVLNIKIEDIVPNRFQPREHFADDGIEELAASIKEHGIIQPLVLRKLGDKFEIVAGERRYKAATLAGLTHVPAIISDIDDNKSAEVALVENIQRRNLTSIEEARSYKAILDKGYLTQEQLAAKMGVSQSQIANKLRLLNLCDEVQDALMQQKISERHARALLNIYDYDEQRRWLNRIIKERLTVRQLDMELKKEKSGSDSENELVPLININNDIDSIRANATDIIKPEVKKDVSSFMIPDENLAKLEQDLKPMEIESNEEETEKEEPLNTNRFFNFLEDEGPNMNMGEPMNENRFFNVDNNANSEFINPFINQPQPTNEIAQPAINNAMPESMAQPQMMQQPQVNNVVPEVAPTPVVNNDININPQPQMMETPATPVGESPVAFEQPAQNNNPFVNNEPAVSINPFLEENPFAQPAVSNEMSESITQPQMMQQPQINNVAPEVVPTPAVNNDININPQPQMMDITATPVTETPVFNEPQFAAQPMNNIAQPLPTATEITNTPGMVNPMENVNNFNQNPASTPISNNGLDMNIAINDIRNLVSKLESQGFYIRLEELALPNGYQINININN